MMGIFFAGVAPDRALTGILFRQPGKREELKNCLCGEKPHDHLKLEDVGSCGIGSVAFVAAVSGGKRGDQK